MYPHTYEKVAENGGFGAVFGVPSTTLPGSAPGRFKALAPSFHDIEPRASFSVILSRKRSLLSMSPSSAT
jgi:hypothetical protein